MIPELAILPKLLTRKNYQKYRKSVNLGNVKNNLKDLYGVYLTLDKMMETIDGEEFTVDDLEAYFWFQHPMAKKDEHEVLSEAIFIPIRVRSTEQPSDVPERLLQEIHARSLASRLALEAYEVSIGKTDISSLLATTKEIQDVPSSFSTASELEFVTDDLNVLLDQNFSSGGLLWPLKSLNIRLGPIRLGDLGVVFARPEAGKTTFLAQAATFMASQAKNEHPIIWFNNEERGSKVKLRLYQAALGRDIAWILANRDEASQQFMELTGGRIKLIDRASIRYDFVERVADQLQPSLMIFDKLDHVKGFDAERKDLVLGAIYRWARELAKIYAPFIGVCHADGTAEGSKWLTMEHMDNAKTSKQETADWILGIGQTHDEGYEYTRYFSLCKNKLLGDENTNPSLRHDRWPVIIKPDTARYEDTK